MDVRPFSASSLDLDGVQWENYCWSFFVLKITPVENHAKVLLFANSQRGPTGLNQIVPWQGHSCVFEDELGLKRIEL